MANPIIFSKVCPLLMQVYEQDIPEENDGWVYCEETTDYDGDDVIITGWVRYCREWVEYKDYSHKAVKP